MVYLQITLKIAAANRPAAAGVYQQFKGPFLATIAGAKSKELLVRDEDVQVLHGFGHAGAVVVLAVEPGGAQNRIRGWVHGRLLHTPM